MFLHVAIEPAAAAETPLPTIDVLCIHAATQPIEPVLSVNAGVLEKLKALKPNHGVLLGKAAVVGEFNDTARKYNLHQTGPMGRDFTIKMVWAPERRRVLFCGANHAVPHRLNDVWEFDLGALTWAMLYAPDLPRDYTGLGKDASDVEFKDGIFITKRGGPGIIGHTWWGLTYDPERREMLFLNTWVTEEKKAAQRLGGDPTQLYAGPPLWAFSPATRTWKMLKTTPPFPRSIFGGMLEYVPELRGSIWHANNWQMHGTWLYDAKTNGWRDLKTNGNAKEFEQQSPEPEQVGYYDPQRSLVIVHRHRATHHFNPRMNEWKKMDAGAPEQVPHGHDAYAPMCHDSASGHGLLVEFKTHALWAYNPDKPAWTLLQPEGDKMPEGGKRLAYFDPVHKVLVILNGTTVWAYRYR